MMPDSTTFRHFAPLTSTLKIMRCVVNTVFSWYDLFIMVKCPRCQFEQPEDVFCASCGVNMQNYRAKHSRPWAIIGVFSLAIILVIGVAVKKFTSAFDEATKKTDILEEALNEPTPSAPPQTNREAPPSLRREQSPGNSMFANI